MFSGYYAFITDRHGAELECYELGDESILDPYPYGEMYANRLGFDCIGEDGDAADYDFRVVLTDDPGGVRVFKSAVFWFVEE